MRLLTTIAALLLVGTSAFADQPSRHRGEFLQMWDAIVAGAPMNGTSGWFKPGQTRFTWDRLKARDKNKDGRITPDELPISPELFAVIDRDGDRAITADDLDWSDNARYFQQLGIAQQFLRQGDADGNRKLSKEEWAALYDRIAKAKGDLDADELRKLLFPPPPPSRPQGPSGMPPKSVLLFGLLTGEIGSGAEGPSLDTIAPDFTLKSPDGKDTITLSTHRGKRPVVLVFGSFT